MGKDRNGSGGYRGGSRSGSGTRNGTRPGGRPRSGQAADMRPDGGPRPVRKDPSASAGRDAAVRSNTGSSGTELRRTSGTDKYARKTYEVQGIDLSSKSDRASAMAEFNMLRDKAQLHYTDFAAQKIRYDKLDDPGAAEKLKEANDAYTMSVFMNCIGPLRSGITPSTLLQSWFSYKMIQTINPTMDMDMARMCANLKRDLEPMYGELRRKNPLMGAVLSPVIGSLDGYLATESAEKFTKAINWNMEQGTLDDAILTPKQTAALKVGFMEQYYVDLRAGERPVRDIDRDYAAAIDHIRIIANNSGYDMAVVAAEERYLVGVKMQADPRYASMFQETSDLYGPHPVLDSDGTWSGRFETPDHHEYTVGGDASTGAFTVRRPMSREAMDGFDRNVDDHGKQIGSMYAWLDGDDCPLGRVTKSRIRKHLDSYVDEYKKNVARQLVDDGAVRNQRQAEQYMDERFDQVVEDTRGRGSLSTDCQTLQMEMRRVVTKEVLAKTGIPVTEETLIAVEGNRKCAALDPLAEYVRERAYAHGDKEFRVEGCEAARQMRDNYIMDMSPEELARLMLHASTNIQQGIKAHGHPNLLRDGKEFVFEEQMAPVVHAPTFNPSRQEDGAFPPAPEPDEDEGSDGPEM